MLFGLKELFLRLLKQAASVVERLLEILVTVLEPLRDALLSFRLHAAQILATPQDERRNHTGRRDRLRLDLLCRVDSLHHDCLLFVDIVDDLKRGRRQVLNHIRLPLGRIQLLPALSAHFLQIKLPENGPKLQNLVIVGVDRVLSLEKDFLVLLLVLELEVFRTGRYPAIRLIQRSAHNRVQVTP